ncbi:MAG: hypothetical protein WBX03_09960, partial [Terriglobales bacterium]
MICSGADTGGGTTLTACEPGMRAEGILRWGALAGGGTTVALNAGARRSFSGATFGAGATAVSASLGACKDGLNPSAG